MFAERLKELRKEKGITQVDLADAMGLSKGTVAMWEVGKREASFETLGKLADYFETPIDYLLGRSDDRSSEAYQEDFSERILGHERKYEELFNDIKALDDYGYIVIERIVEAEKQRCFEMDSLRDPVSGGPMKLKES
ncbi:hypothetical protein SDC9_98018 [bioreactor metagenome]|uniref:HTH cro/C1-type domain-containing protein n=1 Tax=bioreactor metagenome TaxID=1076179 RepID=A0A645ADM9_9ZZZZ|nr:helix-turn-helix transcriptional regulator [Candidatus Metalachnospira sp.]